MSIFRIGLMAVALCVFVPASAMAQHHPGIRHVAPLQGPPGTRVTILGNDFVRGTAVYLGEHMQRIVTRTSTRLVVVIGADATSGMLLVTYGDEEENAGTFEVTAVPASSTGAVH